MKSNIVLIGMPGAGKSTIGVLLAKRTARDFTDTDLLIQRQQNCSLQEIIDTQGPEALRAIEAQLLQTLNLQQQLIATGGSAVYSEAGMAQLKQNGICVFLDVPLEVIERRIDNLDTRGLAREPGQSLSDLYQQRLPLYEKHADKVIDCQDHDSETVCDLVMAALEE